MKKHRKCARKSEAGEVPRPGADTKEVMAEVVGKLTGKLDGKTVLASAEEERRRGGLRPNRDRLTVGVDLGTNGAATAFWVWRERRWPKNSCGQRRS